MKLTAIKCKNAKYGKDGKSISDGHGLYLQLAENGGKYWRYKYRIDKKEKVLAFGVYPEVSLAEAREKHQEAHKLVSEGIDPKMLKQELELQKEAEKENTFELVAREWYEREVPDLQLAHAKKGDVEKAYNRAKFLDERKIMMQEWADYIDGLAKL